MRKRRQVCARGQVPQDSSYTKLSGSSAQAMFAFNSIVLSDGRCQSALFKLIGELRQKSIARVATGHQAMAGQSGFRRAQDVQIVNCGDAWLLFKKAATSSSRIVAGTASSGDREARKWIKPRPAS
jgi:hypothetical protein